VGAGDQGFELPLVSVVTPSLNQGRFIEATIQSVLEQDYPHIEHLVIDGCSADTTIDVLRRYPHLRWVSELDRGQADAVNTGFRMARGTIFAWLNADDLYLPGAISAGVQILQATGCAVVHGSWRQIDEHGETIRDVEAVSFDLDKQLNERNAVAQPGSLFTREAFEAVGGLDTRYRYAMDYELWLRLGERFEVRHVDRVLGAYRLHGDSKTIAEPAGFVPETLEAGRRHGARRFSPIYMDWYLPRRRPWLYRLLIIWRLLRAGDLRALSERVAARARRLGGG